MYFYCFSFGEYEQYTEYTFYHEKIFTEEEFKAMLSKCDEDPKRLCEKFGFVSIDENLTVHYHED
jgi:hypothetical protein